MASEVLADTNLVTREDVLRGPTGRVTASRREGMKSGLQSKGYAYDHLGRLAQHTYSDGTNVPTLSNFIAASSLAQADELTGSDFSYTGSAPSHVTTTAYNLLDNLTSTDFDELGRRHAASFSPAVGGSPPETFGNGAVTLDAHFRIIDDGSLSYVHDGLDRFRTALSGSGVEIDAQYDTSGRRRVETRLKPGGASETVYLHYVGPNVIEEIDGANTVVSTTTYAPGVDTPLIFSEGPTDAASSSTYVLGRNVRGDVIAAIEYSSGNLVEEARYSPWGERQYFENTNNTCVEGVDAGSYSEGKSGCDVAFPVLSRFGISGARAHARTKLVDLRARVYATHLKGFLTRDPLGHIDSHGLWNYVAGDPVNFRDPSGMGSEGNPQQEVVGDVNLEAAETLATLRNLRYKTLQNGSGGCTQKEGCIVLIGATDKEGADFLAGLRGEAPSDPELAPVVPTLAGKIADIPSGGGGKSEWKDLADDILKLGADVLRESVVDAGIMATAGISIGAPAGGVGALPGGLIGAGAGAVAGAGYKTFKHRKNLPEQQGEHTGLSRALLAARMSATPLGGYRNLHAVP